MQTSAFKTFEDAVRTYNLGSPTKTWTYRNADGSEWCQEVRWDRADNKEIRPVHETSEGWVLRWPEGQRPLLNLPELSSWLGDLIFVVEGPKCVDALETLGLRATTSSGGANQAKNTDWAPLARHRVVVLPDNDDGGRVFANIVVAEIAAGNAKADIRVVELPAKSEGEDIADFVERCQTPDELDRLRQQLLGLVEITPAELVWPKNIPGAASLKDSASWTELGLSRRLIAESSGAVRFVADEERWLVWDQDHWERQGATLRVQELAKKVADQLQQEARELPANEVSRGMAFALKSCSKGKIKNMIELARSAELISIRSAELDSDRYVLNCKNGVLDLQKNLLIPHSPHHLISKIAGTEYDRNADCPRWKQFIREVTCGDDELAEFLQRSFGLALSGDVSEQRLWIHYGGGANGKTTCLEVLSKVLGGYAGPIAADLLAQSSKAYERERGRAIHTLVGKRLAVAAESGQDARLSEGLIKMLTGGDTVESRGIYEGEVSVRPTWHIHFSTNHRPNVQGQDYAIWRRLIVVPWNAVFNDDAADPQLHAQLMEEASGILNWLVQGFTAWKSSGLQIPKSVRGAHAEYRKASDPVGRWLDECCERAPEAVSLSQPLYDNYRQWATNGGENPLPKQTFGQSLTSKGLRGEKRGGRRVWSGIRLSEIKQDQ